MQRCALELQAPHWERLDEDLLVPDIAERLDEVQAPTLVLVGEEDMDDMHVLAERFAAEIPRARLAKIPGAAHVPSLEQPAAFDELVLDFLVDTLG
jgi:pimeloyl-ACP methyl ester carboxylesterase